MYFDRIFLEREFHLTPAPSIGSYFKQQWQKIIIKWKIVVMCCWKYYCIFRGIMLNNLIKKKKKNAKLQIILISNFQNYQMDSNL